MLGIGILVFSSFVSFLVGARFGVEHEKERFTRIALADPSSLERLAAKLRHLDEEE